SKLTPLFIIGSLLLGAFAILRTPREEEPQIVVPMLDVFVAMPGASAAEVEQRASIPMERLFREVPGVEYVYSISRPGMSMLVVRFYVGTKEEDAIVKAYNKLYSNFDRIPQGVSQPIIKVRSIDDVPIFAVTLWGKNYDGYQLRQIAGEMDNQLKQIDDVAETKIIGGLPRQVRVTLDTAKLSAYGMTPGAVVAQLQQSNARGEAGSFAQGNQEFAVEAGRFLGTAADLQQIVVGVSQGRPVYLRDVAASITDGPSEPKDYVLYANGAAAKTGASGDYPAVTLTLAKRKGTNATDITRAAEAKIESLRGYLLPADLNVSITRNYGETAKDKSDELLKHLFIATLSVTLLIALALGWRESGVVLIAIPVTLALTLFIFYLFGYTLNRVTLFALIFSIGILVDDAIVVVENIVRHFRMSTFQPNHGELDESSESHSSKTGLSGAPRNLVKIAIEAVDEVGNPTILATFTVIAAILPMAFVRGLMGPYMRPIPVGASAAILFSLIVAFVVSPWSALRLLRHYAERVTDEHEKEGWTTKLYRRIMNPLLESASRRWMFLGGVVVLLLLACSLVAFKLVKVKMLPFDNKSEFQVIVDMPDGTPLEQTTRVAQELGRYLGKQPEVTNYQIYAGTSGPYNFNGLVRHYFLRRGANRADIQVNLQNRHQRSTQSHAIAKRLRPALVEIGNKYGARLKIAEVPPGPPVLETLVAEVYGPDYQQQIDLARKIKQIFQSTPGVVDVDWYVEDPQVKYDVNVDLDKAALNGVSAAAVAETVQIGLDGATAGLLHDPKSREDVPIRVQLDRPGRSAIESLRAMRMPSTLPPFPPKDGVKGWGTQQVSIAEVTNVEKETIDTSRYGKNLRPVVYVLGDVAGQEESPVYAIMKMGKAIDQLRTPDGYQIKQYNF